MAISAKFYLYVFILASCTFAIGWFMLFYGGNLTSRPESYYLVFAGEVLWWPTAIAVWVERFITGQKVISSSFTFWLVTHYAGYFSAALALAAYRSWRMKRKLAIE
ncbi:MAG: hypothetical protein ABL951_16590 [Alphaproteobacteria bacterium]